MILPSCRDVALSLSTGEYDDGSRWNRFVLRLHMIACYICRCYKRQIEFVHRGMRETSSAKIAPRQTDDFQKRLLERLNSGK